MLGLGALFGGHEGGDENAADVIRSAAKRIEEAVKRAREWDQVCATWCPPEPSHVDSRVYRETFALNLIEARTSSIDNMRVLRFQVSRVPREAVGAFTRRGFFGWATTGFIRQDPATPPPGPHPPPNASKHPPRPYHVYICPQPDEI